jgi:hypothetical protein
MIQSLFRETIRMPSFRTSLTPNKRVAARFVVGVRRALLKALTDSGLTQTAIANALGIHRSVVNRELRGSQNLTLSRVGELAWAMGLEPKLTFERPPVADGQNTGNITISRKAAPVPPKAPSPPSNVDRAEISKLNERMLEYA